MNYDSHASISSGNVRIYSFKCIKYVMAEENRKYFLLKQTYTIVNIGEFISISETIIQSKIRH